MECAGQKRCWWNWYQESASTTYLERKGVEDAWSSRLSCWRSWCHRSSRQGMCDLYPDKLYTDAGPYAAQLVSRFSLEDMFITIQGVPLLHGPLPMLSFTSLWQAIEKQRKEDEKVSDLVDQINEVLEFAQHSQELKSDNVYFGKVLVDLLNQATECGIFICQHFQNSFASTSSIYYYIWFCQ